MHNGKFYASFSGNPFFNMAMDEWMFGQAINNPGKIMLRLYTWNSGAITFGYNQNENKVVNRDLLPGTPLIRRVTGGRALYHEPSELTYAIAVNCAETEIDAFRGSLSQSGQAISMALLKFLAAMGVKADFVRQSSPHFLKSELFNLQPCFQSRARHEIVGEGGKIIASAQRRIEDAFLQHGAIKINGVMSHPALESEATNSLDSKGVKPIDSTTFGSLAALFCDIMSQSLGITFKLEKLNELESAQVLAAEEQVREKRLIKRDLIKQIAPQVSLSSECFQ